MKTLAYFLWASVFMGVGLAFVHIRSVDPLHAAILFLCGTGCGVAAFVGSLFFLPEK